MIKNYKMNNIIERLNKKFSALSREKLQAKLVKLYVDNEGSQIQKEVKETAIC